MNNNKPIERNCITPMNPKMTVNQNQRSYTSKNYYKELNLFDFINEEESSSVVTPTTVCADLEVLELLDNENVKNDYGERRYHPDLNE